MRVSVCVSARITGRCLSSMRSRKATALSGQPAFHVRFYVRCPGAATMARKIVWDSVTFPI